MSVSYFVRYQSLGAAVDSFDEYYCRQHADILAQMPGIRSLLVHRPVSVRDPHPTFSDATEFLAQLTFDSADALAAALQSEARERSRADFANLGASAATVTHQSMKTRRLF